jgi:transposase
MKKFILSSEEKEQLEYLHKKTKDVRESDRIRAILFRSEGWSISMIALALRKHVDSVSRFIDDYFIRNKLKPENGGSESHLNKKQSKDLITHLEKNIYLTSNAIREYILDKYGVHYSIPGLIKWLNQNHFVYKKPVGFPSKANEIKQKEFIEYYNDLKSKKTEDDVILFIDSVHPSQNTKLAYGWIKKGINKAIETTASRTRLNIVGAINLQDLTNPIFSKFDTINQESIIEFLFKIRDIYTEKDKINIILDGAGYHKATNVQNTADKLNIKLHFMPPYSPNLNPIERLWKIMNEQARNNKYFATKKCFINAIDNFLYDKIPKLTSTLCSRITDNFQVLVKPV